jgi:hypothetical protein
MFLNSTFSFTPPLPLFWLAPTYWAIGEFITSNYLFLLKKFCAVRDYRSWPLEISKGILSFSMLLSKVKICSNCRDRSSSTPSYSGLVKVLFELQIVHVPGLPVYSVCIPLQVCLKICCTCFKRSRADIFWVLGAEVGPAAPPTTVLFDAAVL